MTATIEKIISDDVTESKLSSLIKDRKSFSILSVSDMSAMAVLIEKAIESNDLSCRIYTENRAAAMAAGVIPTGITQLGALATAVGIAAHNLATFNPDYEVGKNIVDNTINATYKK